jgi:glutamate/aspartate transport system permease protein
VPLIVQFFTWYLVVPEFLPENIGMWFKSELDPNIQFFVSSMLCLGLFTAARVCEQVRAASSRCRAGKERRSGDGADPAANLPLRAAAERLSRYRAADDLGNDEPGEKLGHRLHHRSGRYGRAGGQLLDYSAHAWESFTAITLAYVFINAVIMLIMYVVERKVRLPGNMGGK